MQTLSQVLQDRDDMSQEEAEALIAEARVDLKHQLDDPDFDVDDFMDEWFGLEPDYFEELL